jgi:hypothetical protein
MKKKLGIVSCRLFTLSFQQRAPLRKRSRLLPLEKRTTESKITGPHSSPRAARFTPMTSTPLAALACALSFLTTVRGAELLPSWNATAPKQAIVAFVDKVTREGSPDFVKPEERIATFDNDNTLWVEQPNYTQVTFAIDEVVAMAPQHPESRQAEPFTSILAHDREAMLKFSIQDFEKVVAVSHSVMTVQQFQEVLRSGSPKRSIRVSNGLIPNAYINP